eukprot:6348699-Lingulodinium_polyedra.AAC.1
MVCRVWRRRCIVRTFGQRGPHGLRVPGATSSPPSTARHRRWRRQGCPRSGCRAGPDVCTFGTGPP